jgi:predicted RNA methylase
VTGHRDVRLADDQYDTPEWCTRLLLPHLQRGDVLDPCCGVGAIGKPICEAWTIRHDDCRVDGVELDGERVDAALAAGYFDQVVQNDYLTRHKDRHYPLIITNPPFSLAMPFLEKALQEADTVAFLLRLAWLASAERNAFHRANPSDLIVLPKRPSFAKFVSCVAPNNCNTEGGWRQTYKPSEEHPKKCPSCFRKVKVSSSDSADYGWFIWGPGRGGRIIHPQIDVEQVHRVFDGAAAQLEELTR